MGKIVLVEGVPGVFIPSLTKTSRWWKGIRILRVYVRIIRILFPDIWDGDLETPPLGKGYLDTQGICPDTPGIVPDIPDRDPETPILAEKLLKKSF
jgi:hypothetical protein